MKKQISIMVLMLICALVAGCSDNNINTIPNDNSNQQTQENSKKPIADYIDLTQMSGTMVYAEVYNIMTNADDYLGKIIKMGGTYDSQADLETGILYHFVLIYDATGCCPSGVEFILNNGNYPEPNTEIEVEGVFKSYKEDGQTYYHLVADDSLIVK